MSDSLAVSGLQTDNIRFAYRQYQAPMLAAFRPHAHDLWELLYVPNGNASCMIEGRRYRLSSHSLLIFRPARIHRIHVEGDTVYQHYSLMCDADSMIPQLAGAIPGEVEVLSFQEDRSVERLLQEMRLHSEQSTGSACRRMLTVLMEELFAKIVAAAQEQPLRRPDVEDPVVREATEFIEENIIALESVEEMCNALGVNKKRLYDLFIRHMLIAPKKYMQVKRLALVQKALRSGANKTLLLQYGYRDYDAFRNAYYRFYMQEP